MADDAFRDRTENKSSASIDSIFRTAVAHNLPVAVWRLPETGTVQVCISLEPAVQVTQPSLENSPFGFLFCPFTSAAQHPDLFIKGDILYSESTGQLQAGEGLADAAFQTFKDWLATPASGSRAKWHLPEIPDQIEDYGETVFIQVVQAGIAEIRNELMEKVVLSRSKAENLPAGFDPLNALKRMLANYPRAFVSLVSIPGVGAWLGASPEILVSIDKQNIFRTVALAGTQPADDDTSLANAIWRQKEIEEQGMVERYILSCFKKLRLREYTEVGPRTIIAGNLMHLRTDYKVDLQEVDFPTLGTDMLHLLHPTSAICGLPKEPALEFIKKYEGYDRSYYSGYLGPVNSPDGTHLYVNLRCMQIMAETAVLYAGAGITAESSPEKEYFETQFKMQTMRKILE